MKIEHWVAGSPPNKISRQGNMDVIFAVDGPDGRPGGRARRGRRDRLNGWGRGRELRPRLRAKGLSIGVEGFLNPRCGHPPLAPPRPSPSFVLATRGAEQAAGRARGGRLAKACPGGALPRPRTVYLVPGYYFDGTSSHTLHSLALSPSGPSHGTFTFEG